MFLHSLRQGFYAPLHYLLGNIHTPLHSTLSRKSVADPTCPVPTCPAWGFWECRCAKHPKPHGETWSLHIAVRVGWMSGTWLVEMLSSHDAFREVVCIAVGVASDIYLSKYWVRFAICSLFSLQPWRVYVAWFAYPVQPANYSVLRSIFGLKEYHLATFI